MKDKIKIYTFYSESHKEIYNDYFLKSFNENKLYEDFEIDVTVVEQKSKTGNFNSFGFNETMNDKLNIIKRAIVENRDNIFIYADCDIQFFKNFKSDIVTYIDDNDNDMFAQNDVNTICAGFFMAKVTLEFEEFINYVESKHMNYSNDQICMNIFKDKVKYKLLPVDKYFSIGNYNGGMVWNGEENINIPINIMVHHANFTIGVDNKVKLFEFVKKSIKLYES